MFAAKKHATQVRVQRVDPAHGVFPRRAFLIKCEVVVNAAVAAEKLRLLHDTGAGHGLHLHRGFTN